MCGIVGYIGSGNSVNIVLEGLSRLEYRGYDSAGISLQNEKGNLVIFKKEGQLGNLRKVLEKERSVSPIAIGHTRWATHGGVNDLNAHPHGNDQIAIVHNGIIENSGVLKQELISEGRTFQSQTDSEVFLVLVTKYFEKLGDLKKAVVEAFKQIRGNSAFVVIRKNAQEIVSIRRSAPMICGKNTKTDEVFVSSDPYALVGFADLVFFPENEVICHLVAGKIEFFELDGKPSNRYHQKEQLMTLDIADKGGFEHFMLKEIHEQPKLIRALATYYISGEGKTHLKNVENIKKNRLHITGCGTAYHAGLVIKNFLEAINRIPANIELASEFRYKNPILHKDDLALFITQSGETADTLASLELCHDLGMKTLGIVNVEGSSIYRKASENLLIKAGQEIGVASTKAFTLQALTGYLFSKALAHKSADKSIHEEMNLLADRIEALLVKTEEIKAIAEKIYQLKGFIFTGRGVYYPIALEGALKLKEIAYVHAEGYAAGELKHGPIALIDDNMVNIAIVGPELHEKTFSNVEEVKARRGIIVSLGDEKDAALANISDHFIGLNFEGLEFLSPLYVNVATQLLSYYMARFKGTDIDKPRNLAKSVTVE
ncbi:MAG: glutamine--fructose-6-phosphate transaminase (isomerizing) [Bacteriovoracaceae bacterium]